MRKISAKPRAISFAEIRQLLISLGYKEKSLLNAHVFHRRRNERVFFRRYEPTNAIDPWEVSQARLFLDARGILAEADFDAFFERPATSA